LGGNGTWFHSGLMLEVARTAHKKVEEKVIGQSIQIKAVKNKFTLPFKVRTFDLHYRMEKNPM
jgi:RecA/RadA recombinase